MMRIGELVLNQSKKVLENKQYAIFCAALLSVLPFASWLSVALVVLVTLRKGGKLGFEVLVPALIIHTVPLLLLVPVGSALINTLIAYLPCYFAALTLRSNASWQAVAGVFFLQALIAFVLVQWLIPDLAMVQFNQFKKLLSHYNEYQQFIETSIEGINPWDLAQLFLGIQILSVVVSSIISLLFARFIQAKLFVPGGLKAELADFRSGKLAFLVLLATSVASYNEFAFAINLLPLALGYFLLAGFNLSYVVLARRLHFKAIILLILLIVLQPTFVLFAYVIFGLLDSLFNFRLYLPSRASESI
ncbi:hypothetical protein [Legionella sp. km772]|uniref:hypothetical protein n=1 Tax=Legionella sp. km772 TaxID=2498111 RepID=UPI000F8F1A7E|nr:hypothetical protein [Legionella sp. km772]RUR13203.1 hypothetical protein ELY15_03055 [Legionella sp. km772]